MTDRRDPERKLLADNVRNKRTAAARAVVIKEMQKELIGFHLRGRLRHFDDFELFIGLVNVTDSVGRINYPELERRLEMLLLRRPELGAPSPE
ncbi:MULTISPECIES: hypothetical protein [unclassified Leifsonia]|uniref:hypothetical protein n=1 Tax=unclassified Leifsonia TaxID=2663824 RepID=UPI0006F5A98D|nr:MULTISPECIES: hypothetical protein [unclassified Leifsonia]KQX07336.1 hypothetical protein ASC59_06035 [Leifsonia sp. Root1293]KRA11618.1 hypothetical protein ASD61_06035 [Leifsonia sp. Root60]